MSSLPHLLSRLGRVIRTRRIQAGYSSQERFGYAVGLHRTYMGHLERGNANPTMQTLHTVAQQLGLTILDLLTLATSEDGGTAPATGLTGTGRPWGDEPQGEGKERGKGGGRGTR